MKSSLDGYKKPAKAGDDAGAPSRSKREQVVNAAIELFLLHGYEGTSMDQVAAKAGVVKPTIYSHFKDKRALFKAVLEELILEEGMLGIEMGARSVTAEKFFDMFSLKVLSLKEEQPQFLPLMRVIIGESGRFPEISQLFYETVSVRASKLIVSFLEKHEELRIPDPEAAAQIMSASLVYWMLSQELMGGKFIAPIDPQRIVNMLKILFLERIRS